MMPAGDLFVAARADSARIVAGVYATALLSIIPMVVAGVLAWRMRRATAAERSLIWRAAIIALVVLLAGREVPLHWIAWVVPSVFATPLVALGRVQVTADSVGSGSMLHAGGSSGAGTAALVLFAVYALGVLVVVGQTAGAWIHLQSRVRRARPAGARLRAIVAGACRSMGHIRRPRVLLSPSVSVPMTWGWRRPVVVLPVAAHTWSAAERRMAILHELAHVRSGDWAFFIVGRALCALLWFHPGVWWIVRALRDTCEEACDDRVIASGVRRSDYAELLLRAAPLPSVSGAFALARRRGLRGRLDAVLDVRHDVRPLAPRRAAMSLLLAGAAAAPVSVVQLAPTKTVLTSLMLDAKWESRAYAVLGLAQRADSLAVAQSAAELDPNPRVRAWARYALDRHAGLPPLAPPDSVNEP